MEDNTDNQQQVTEIFKELVITWVDLDDKIRQHNSKVKEYKNEKKDYEEKILTYLENIGENVIEISDGKLRKNVSKTKAPLKQQTIEAALTECIKDSKRAAELTQYIFKNRPVVERINLKRTKNRGPKN
ncbi:hypothetical protein CPAV1605_714 [seawater metagenome]|uniref:Uncharacterized protein n=1 Tax=seawater metagenome TaxID=1561972 RepID=A0A5E8CK16_9ZZZZ